MKHIIITLIIACGIVLSAQPVAAQTISEDDLYGFVGVLSSPYINGRHETEYSGFVRWQVLPPDSARRRHFSEDYLSRDLAAMTVVQNDAIPLAPRQYRWRPEGKQYANYRFYMMYDGSRWGARNILSAWEAIPGDSLRFVCMYPTENMSEVYKVGFFPDSSLLVVVAEHNGDADFVNGAYSFLRSKEDLCGFEEIYRSDWIKGEGKSDNKFIFYNIDMPVREITEVTEYSTAIDGKYAWNHDRVDSATTKIIDLWGLVQEKE